MKSKAKPKSQSKSRPVTVPPKPLGYSYDRFTMGDSSYYEKKSPILRVPGMRNTRWNPYIGRWVVSEVSHFQ